MHELLKIFWVIFMQEFEAIMGMGLGRHVKITITIINMGQQHLIRNANRYELGEEVRKKLQFKI